MITNAQTTYDLRYIEVHRKRSLGPIEVAPAAETSRFVTESWRSHEYRQRAQ
jgi:hypothetical protein